MQSQKPVHITDLITPSHNRPHKGRLVSINEGYIIDWNCIVIVWLLCGACKEAKSWAKTPVAYLAPSMQTKGKVQDSNRVITEW